MPTLTSLTSVGEVAVPAVGAVLLRDNGRSGCLAAVCCVLGGHGLLPWWRGAALSTACHGRQCWG